MSAHRWPCWLVGHTWGEQDRQGGYPIRECARCALRQQLMFYSNRTQDWVPCAPEDQ